MIKPFFTEEGSEKILRISIVKTSTFKDCIIFAQHRSVIGPENTRHPLNQSDAKRELITTWSLAFSRALDNVVGFEFHWCLKIFPFPLIGRWDYVGFKTTNRKALYLFKFWIWEVLFSLFLSLSNTNLSVKLWQLKASQYKITHPINICARSFSFFWLTVVSPTVIPTTPLRRSFFSFWTEMKWEVNVSFPLVYKVWLAKQITCHARQGISAQNIPASTSPTMRNNDSLSIVYSLTQSQ